MVSLFVTYVLCADKISVNESVRDEMSHGSRQRNQKQKHAKVADGSDVKNLQKKIGTNCVEFTRVTVGRMTSCSVT